MAEIHLTAEELSTLDMIIEEKQGKSHPNFIPNWVVPIIQVTVTLVGGTASEKALKSSVVEIVKNASVDDLIKIRKGAVRKP